MIEQDVYQWFLSNLDFWQNFLLVIIPVLITIGSSKWIVNSWQIQKEKSELRKNILSEFDESYPKLGQYMFETFFKIRYAYVDPSKVEYDKPTRLEDLVFPDEVEAQPLKKFNHILEEIHSEFSIFNSATTKFLSSVTLYFDNISEIRDECKIINEYGSKLYKLLHQIIYSQNKEDFIKWCREYEKINKLQLEKINFVKIILVYERIKNPEKNMSLKFLKGFKQNPSTIYSKPRKNSSYQDNTLSNSES